MRREACGIGLRVRCIGEQRVNGAGEGIVCQLGNGRHVSRVKVDWLSGQGESLRKPSWIGFLYLVAAPHQGVPHA